MFGYIAITVDETYATFNWAPADVFDQQLPIIISGFPQQLFFFRLVAVPLHIHWLAVPSVFQFFIYLFFFFTRPVPHTRPSESIDFFVVVSFETCHYPNSVIPIAI